MDKDLIEREVTEFYQTGFEIKAHLADYLGLSILEVDERLPLASKKLELLHPGAFNDSDPTGFYEDVVGTAHLFELAAWHLSSSNYIANTLKLQHTFAYGQVLDFGGGIGTHALAAAKLQSVDHVWFVDLNPQNRLFVKRRAELLGLDKKISVYRDLKSTGSIKFDTLVCLDVLEHLSDPSSQLIEFLNRLHENSIAIMNWYFFKGFNGEYPFHFDDRELIERFFSTLQSNFIEVFHPFLITTRAYKPNK